MEVACAVESRAREASLITCGSMMAHVDMAKRYSRAQHCRGIVSCRKCSFDALLRSEPSIGVRGCEGQSPK